MEGQRTCPTPSPHSYPASLAWLCGNTTRTEVTVSAPGPNRSPELEETEPRAPRSGRCAHESQCGKASTGLQGPVIGVNFSKSTPKTSDTEIA